MGHYLGVNQFFNLPEERHQSIGERLAAAQKIEEKTRCGLAQQKSKRSILCNGDEKWTSKLHERGTENDPFNMGRKGSCQTNCNRA